MTVLIIVLFVIFLLLLWNVKIIYEIKLRNFDFSACVKLKFPFEKTVFDSKTKKPPKEVGEEKEKTSRKMEIEDLIKLKKPVVSLFTEVCRILKLRCRIVRVDTVAKLALEDPMENGIAYGVVSGGLGVASGILQNICSAGEVTLDVQSDFNSGEGFVFENKGILRIYPVVTLFSVLFSRKLIKEVKNIVNILKKEENNNG